MNRIGYNLCNNVKDRAMVFGSDMNQVQGELKMALYGVHTAIGMAEGCTVFDIERECVGVEFEFWGHR